jgi:dynein heavy chain
MFPSLVNCCTINWLPPWPEEALFSVAKMFISNIESEDIDQSIRDSICSICVFTHLLVTEETEIFFKMLRRRVYNTPKHYIDLLKSYEKVLREKKEEVKSARDKLANGLTKLDDTNK